MPLLSRKLWAVVEWVCVCLDFIHMSLERLAWLELVGLSNRVCIGCKFPQSNAGFCSHELENLSKSVTATKTRAICVLGSDLSCPTSCCTCAGRDNFYYNDAVPTTYKYIHIEERHVWLCLMVTFNSESRKSFPDRVRCGARDEVSLLLCVFSILRRTRTY